MVEDDDLRPEYPPELIRGGVRGKYYQRYRQQSNIVAIDSDLSAEFPNAKAVNDVLRAILRTREEAVR